MPAYPVQIACTRLAAANIPVPIPARAGASRHDPRTTLLALNAAVNVYVNYTGSLGCHNVSAEVVGKRSKSATAGKAATRLQQPKLSGSGLGDIWTFWNYQVCLILMDSSYRIYL